MTSAVRQVLLVLLLAVVALPLAAPEPAEARDARIEDLFLTNTDEEVLIYFRVVDCFTPEMEEAILAGITTTFLFTIELYQHRSLWFDRKEASRELRHSIKYDSVKRTLYLSYSYRGGEPQQFSELARARDSMADVSGIPIAPLANLVRGQQYYVRVRARLDRVPLPLEIRSPLFFSSRWHFETDWTRQDFIY